MNETRNYSLIGPDGTSTEICSLPGSRSEAIDIVKNTSGKAGSYRFTQRVNESTCGEIDLPILTLSISEDEQYGVTYWNDRSGVSVNANDIVFYLSRIVGIRSGEVSHIRLRVFEDRPDNERSLIWLTLENRSGKRIAEFGLDVSGHMALSMESELSEVPVYLCELPSPRSVIRFASIACSYFRVEQVQISPIPLNADSTGWFG